MTLAISRYPAAFLFGAVLAFGASPPYAHAQLQCSAGTLTFYPSGALKSCRVDAHHRFYTAQGDTIDCVSGHVVTQYPDGEIQSCTIDRPHQFGGMLCEQPGAVELTPEGNLRACGSG